jgi:hypothetical protein
LPLEGNHLFHSELAAGARHSASPAGSPPSLSSRRSQVPAARIYSVFSTVVKCNNLLENSLINK